MLAMHLDVAPIEMVMIRDDHGLTRLGPSQAVFTLERARDQLALILSGRAAEDTVFGTIGSGGGRREAVPSSFGQSVDI